MKSGNLGKMLLVLVMGLVVLGFAIYNTVCEWKPATDTPPVVEQGINVPEVIKAIADKKKATQQDVGEVSLALAEVIAKDPAYVLVCLVIEEAKGFPKITETEAATILGEAAQDSASAVTQLEILLHARLKEEMIVAGHDPYKANKQLGWVNNNGSTALLFLDYPLAVKLGKVKELVTRKIQGRPEGDEWYQPQITFEQYCAWHGSGKWPFAE